MNTVCYDIRSQSILIARKIVSAKLSSINLSRLNKFADNSEIR